MAEFNFAEFETHLRASGLLKEDQIREIESGGYSDARYAAKELIARNWLTEWQAKCILSGKTQLLIGNYQLLERLERNDLGDRYLALHGSLKRKVILQFLPRSFLSSSPHFDSFIQSANMLTETDHPNLAHVYDVGAEGGRYYVVQEHIDGEPLSSLKPGAIQRKQAVKFIQDLASVVRCLHDRRIEHGTISEQNVWLTHNGDIQVLDLIGNELQKKVLGIADDRPQSVRQEFGLIDRVGVQAVCGQIMEIAFGKEADTEILGAIVQLSRSEQSIDRLMEVTNAWLATHDNSSSTNSLPGQLNNLSSSQKRVPAKEPKAGMSPRKQARVGRERVPAQKGALRFAFGIAAGLVAVGLCYLAYLALSGPNSNRLAMNGTDLKAQPDGQRRVGDKLASRGGPDEKRKTPDAFDRTSSSLNESLAGLESPSSGSPPTTQAGRNQTADSSEAKGNAGDATLADPPKRQSETTSERVPADTAESDSKPVAVDPSSLQFDPDDPFTVLSGAETPPQPASKEMAGQGRAASDPPAQSIEQRPSPSSGPSVAESLPAAVDLQPTTYVAPQRLGAVPVTDYASLTLQIRFHPDWTGRGKNYFSTKADNSNSSGSGGRSWDILYGKREDPDQMEVVGKVSCVNQELTFQWQAGVEERSNANYLVNTILELSFDGASEIIALRTPVVIDEICLDEKNFGKKGSINLSWAPSGDAIRFEAGPLNPEKWAEAIWVNESQADKLPAIIRFSEDENEQIFWIALSLESKARVEYRVDVQTLDNGILKSLKPTDLRGGLELVSRQYQNLVLENDRAQQAAEVAPYGQKTKTRDYARSVRQKMEEFQAYRERALNQADVIEGLVNVPIPLRLVYEFDGQLIELARSSTFSDPNENPQD